MRLFRHFINLPENAQRSVICLGNFDGVHRGHQAIIRNAARVAKKNNVPLGVVSFEPHPRTFFQPDNPPFRLTPFRIKARHLEACDVDLLFVLHFDQSLSEKSAKDFVEDVLVQGLNVSHVVIGKDFYFGHSRKGTAAFLQAEGARCGFGVTVLDLIVDEEPLSSTKIRRALQHKKPEIAADILGRYWEIEGRVVYGDRRGRLLGYPTANVEMGEYLRPSYGVYAVRAGLDEGMKTRWYDGVANLGIRPMYEAPDPLLEAHFFDFDGDLYGRHIRVQLIRYLRGEEKFDSTDALIHQMHEDSRQARAILKKC